METPGGKRQMLLLRERNRAQSADHGSHRSDFARRQKYPGQRGALLQNVQHRQKTTPANGVGRIPQQRPYKGKRARLSFRCLNLIFFSCLLTTQFYWHDQLMFLQMTDHLEIFL